MSLSITAQRVLKVLQETGPRPLTVISGFVKGDQAKLERLIGELFISGRVKWVSSKRWRRLAAMTRTA